VGYSSCLSGGKKGHSTRVGVPTSSLGEGQVDARFFFRPSKEANRTTWATIVRNGEKREDSCQS